MKYRIKLRVTAPGSPHSSDAPRKVAFELEEGQRFYLGGKTDGIDFTHPSVLPEHCFLVVRGGALTVSDISGGRATLNGEKIISSSVALEDRLQMGEYAIEFLEVPVPPPAVDLDATRPIETNGPEFELELKTLSGMRPRAPVEDEPSITYPSLDDAAFSVDTPSLGELVHAPPPLHEPSARVEVAEIPRPQARVHAMDLPVEIGEVPRSAQRRSRGRRHADAGPGAFRGAFGRGLRMVRFAASAIFFLLQLGLVAGSITGGYWFLQEYSKAGTLGVAIDEVRSRARVLIPSGRPRTPEGEVSRAPATQPEPAARAQDRFLATQLLEAARKGNLIAMRNLVNDARVNVDYRSAEGVTPLMAAAEAGQLEMVRLLAATGADLNAVDVNGTTPLMWAVLRDHRGVIAFLVARGAKVLLARPNGETALNIALRWGYAETARFLAAPQAHPRYGMPSEPVRATASEPRPKSGSSKKREPSSKRGPSSRSAPAPVSGKKSKAAQVRPSFVTGRPEKKKSRGSERREQKLDLTRHD